MALLKEKERENALNEVRILASLSDEFVVGYKEAFIEDSNLCIIMEFAEGGDIQKVINEKLKTRSYYSEKEIWNALT